MINWQGFAKAAVVDAIRDYLGGIGPRNVGLSRLADHLHCPPVDVYSALRYLQARDEVTHEAHRGWRYVPAWEVKRRIKV